MRKPLTGAAPVTLRTVLRHQACPSLMGSRRRADLVHRDNFQLRGITRAIGRAGHFLCAGAGRDDGFRHLGRLHLEGVRQCSRRVTPVYPADVSFLSAWSWCDCCRASLSLRRSPRKPEALSRRIVSSGDSPGVPHGVTLIALPE